MFKVGDEVFVKGNIAKIEEEGSYPISVGFDKGRAEWFEEEELIPVGKTYEQGLADAWELAKKIYDMKCDAIEEIFGVKGGFYDVIRNFTFEDCRDKIEAHEKEKEIKVGDEVAHGEGTTQIRFFATLLEKNRIEGYDENGYTHAFTFPNPYIKKTGKRIGIEGLLKQIGE